MYYEYGWRPYVPVAERRRKAARELGRLKKKGRPISPVVIEGRAIAKTFWGKAWCDNLERYSDFANRLPRGRTYVRNGSVVDLQIGGGEVKALVSGSEIYKVEVKVKPVSKARWRAICADCAGGIDSLVELLQGRFSKGVMERLCRQRTGLFPSPEEIQLSCSCPDWASMCKHVAAVLYGIGARLDQQPELLFKLHEVDEKELIAKAGRELPLARKAPAAEKTLASEDLSAIFGLEMAQTADSATPAPVPATKPERIKKPAKKIAKAGADLRGTARPIAAKPTQPAPPATPRHNRRPLKNEDKESPSASPG
ncbi:MAG: SWIM zinc finger family protein [Acidobacteriia bacterium]|nr:SWIM zinc finger family protein [Terriglobia bacterium]